MDLIAKPYRKKYHPASTQLKHGYLMNAAHCLNVNSHYNTLANDL